MRLLKLFIAVVFAWAFIFVPAQASADATTVILVRHGKTTYNAQNRPQGFLDIPLNEEGLKQADMLAKYFKDTPIDVFIASPLSRAYVTTEKVAKAHKMTVAYTDNRLKEINYGDWAGLTPDEQKEKFPELTNIWNKTPWLATFPNGENLRDVEYRTRAALEDAVAKYPGKTIFIGAHSHVNTVILCSVLGIDLEHFNQLKQNNTCINVLKYENGTWTVVTMNSLIHLGKLAM